MNEKTVFDDEEKMLFLFYFTNQIKIVCMLSVKLNKIVKGKKWERKFKFKTISCKEYLLYFTLQFTETNDN